MGGAQEEEPPPAAAAAFNVGQPGHVLLVCRVFDRATPFDLVH